MAIKTNIYGKKITPFEWQDKAKNYKDLQKHSQKAQML
jgi:hypothetical protein